MAGFEKTDEGIKNIEAIVALGRQMWERRERALELLRTQGPMWTSQLAHALGVEAAEVDRLLKAAPEAEPIGDSRDGRLWHLRPLVPKGCSGRGWFTRFFNGISP